MGLPVPSDSEPIPPHIALMVDAYNFKILAGCISRQDSLIDAIEDYNSRK